MKYYLFTIKHSLASFFSYLTFPKECGLCGKNAGHQPSKPWYGLCGSLYPTYVGL